MYWLNSIIKNEYTMYRLTAALALPLVCFSGDSLLSSDKVLLHGFFKALVDSGVHFSVGGLSWLVAGTSLQSSSVAGTSLQSSSVAGTSLQSSSVNPTVKQLTSEVVLAATLSSLVDLDHFIAAKSFSLKAATSLQSRPFLHDSLVPILVLLTSLLLGLLDKSGLITRLGILTFSSLLSHHFRDAWRRGLWFRGIGVLELNYWTYIFLTFLFPFFNTILIRMFSHESSYDSRKYTLLEV